MKIGLISDIHGNFEALRVVLSELDRAGIREIYCLGDVVGYYSQVNECCDELRRRQISSLMGNHDWYMASGGFCPRSKSANDCLEYQRKVISKENLDWVRGFGLQLQMGDIWMVHGGWADPIDEYLQPSAEYFARMSGRLFISGHTHVQTFQDFGSQAYCNPGSVGQPRDNDSRAAFAIYDGEIKLYRVSYDIGKVCDLMDKAGFNDYYYGSLTTGASRLHRLVRD